MHTKCPECNTEFTPEELHDASLEDHLEYKRTTNKLIKELRLKLEHDQLFEWCKAKLNDYVIGLEAENARYREALQFYSRSKGTWFWQNDDADMNICLNDFYINDMGFKQAGRRAHEALKGE